LTGEILSTAPSSERQITDLANAFPGYLQQMGEGIQAWLQHSIFGQYYDQGYQWLIDTLSDIPDEIGEYIGGVVEGVRNVATSVTNVLVAIVTLPIILFVLFTVGHRFKAYSFLFVAHILINIDRQVGSYIRAQTIVATCIGILLYIGYLIIGLDYAIILAITAAITSVVPYLGPMIAISPAIIIAIVHSPFTLLKLAIVWA